MIDWLYLTFRDAWELNLGPLRLLHFTHSRMLLAFLTSFVLVWWWTPHVIKQLYRRGIRDRVRDYDATFCQSKAGTPTMGGIVIVGALLVSTSLWCNPIVRVEGGPANPIPLLVMALIFFSGIGALDDWLKVRAGNADGGLSRKFKLLLQTVFALLFAGLMMNGDTSPLLPAARTELYVPFLPPYVDNPDIGWLYYPLIVFAFLGISNALNLTDGLDGLAIVPAGLTLFVFGVFAYFFSVEALAATVRFEHIETMAEVVVFCCAAFGAAIGFLWYNAYPAQLFMGDTGSMALGGTIAAVAVVTKTELVFLIAGAVFVWNFLSVLIQDSVGIRRVGRRFLFRAPMHHGFQHRGMPETKLVVRFWILSLVLASISVATLKFR